MKTLNKALTYTAILVGTYLLVSRATASGRLITSSASAYVRAVKALQGR